MGVICHDRLGIYGGGGSPESEGAVSFLLGINGAIEWCGDGGGKRAVVCGCPDGMASETVVGDEDDGRSGSG